MRGGCSEQPSDVIKVREDPELTLTCQFSWNFTAGNWFLPGKVKASGANAMGDAKQKNDEECQKDKGFARRNFILNMLRNIIVDIWLLCMESSSPLRGKESSKIFL